MTTGNTTLLGLALPVTGELSGSWGDVVSNSITQLVDSAVAGTTTLSTDADVTLTATALVANQARQAILLCTGARTAQRTITAPALSKTYNVINTTTGGFAVKLVGAGPTTGITLIAGENALVAWNGADFVKVSSSIPTISISTGVSGLGTGVATALAVNVGSAGAPVVFNGALGTPASGTVTNLTGTASININGTVGATTPTTGAFTTLNATTVNGPVIATLADMVAGVSNSMVATPAAVASYVGPDTPVRFNSRRITSDLTIGSAYNAASVGPIFIADGITVTVQDNATWSIN